MNKGILQIEMENIATKAIDIIKNSDNKALFGTTDIEYASDEGGYCCDTLMFIDEDGNVYFSSEDYKYDSNYDYVEDEDGIVFGPYDITSISVMSLVELASKITNDKSLKEEYYKLAGKIESTFKNTEGVIDIPPTLISLDYDCGWYSVYIIKVSKNMISAGERLVFYFDDDALIVKPEELALVADAILNKD